MKNSVKKILSAALVLVMALCLSVSAFAAITQAEARAIALKAVLLDEKMVAFEVPEIDYDRKGSVSEYEFDFYVKLTDTSYMKYEVDVSAVDGKVIKTASELEQRPTLPTTPTDPSADIGKENAKKFAFAEFGVSADDASLVKVEIDREDGRRVYEIEFFVGNVEYSCTIDAATGAVLEREVENNTSVFERIAQFFEMIFAFFKNLFA